MSGAVSEPGLSKNPSKWLKKKCLKTSICTLDAKCECDSLESNKEIALQSLILQVLVWLGDWKFVPPSKQMSVKFCDFVEQ